MSGLLHKKLRKVLGFLLIMITPVVINGLSQNITIITSDNKSFGNIGGSSTVQADLSQFQGIGVPIEGISTASFSETHNAFQISSTSSNNISLFVDDTHGWRGTDVIVNVSNIKDNRDWVQGGSYNDSVVDPVENPSFTINQDGYPTHYPLNGTHLGDMTVWETKQIISLNESRAI
ncbi:MAG: hypothetical protein ACFFCS_23580, partial [Candidatus Hodarchaeota archaeon]